MNISELIGREVLDKSGNNVGKVVDIDVNISEWSVDYLVVKVGLIKKIPITVDKIDKVGDKIILKTAKSEMEKKVGDS